MFPESLCLIFDNMKIYIGWCFLPNDGALCLIMFSFSCWMESCFMLNDVSCLIACFMNVFLCILMIVLRVAFYVKRFFILMVYHVWLRKKREKNAWCWFKVDDIWHFEMSYFVILYCILSTFYISWRFILNCIFCCWRFLMCYVSCFMAIHV